MKVFDQLKAALTFKRAADQFRKDEKMGYDWTKSIKAGVTQILTLMLTAAITAVLGVLSDNEAIKGALVKADVNDAYAAALLLVVGGLARVLQNAWKHNKPGAGVPGAMILLALLPAVSWAQAEPAPPPATELKNSVTLSTGGTRFYTHGLADKTELEGHLLAVIHTPEKTITEALARFTRVQGAETDGDLLNPRTFRAFVGTVSVRRALSGFLDAQCLVGVSWDRDKDFDPEDPNVWRVGCGPRFWLEGRGSLSVIVNHDGSVGGRALSGELVIKQGDRARYYATYAVPLSAARFRVNPFAITTGVQLDVKRWTF